MTRVSTDGERDSSGRLGESVVGSRVIGDKLGSLVLGLRVTGDKEGLLVVGLNVDVGFDGSKLWEIVGSNVNEGLELGTGE